MVDPWQLTDNAAAFVAREPRAWRTLRSGDWRVVPWMDDRDPTRSAASIVAACVRRELREVGAPETARLVRVVVRALSAEPEPVVVRLVVA